MEVEFIARFPKELTKEQKQDLNDQAKLLMLVDGDLNMRDALNKVQEDDDEIYQYGPWSLEMNDITDYTMVDAEHTRIIKHNGMSMVFLIPYVQFKMIKQFTTGRMCANYLDFMMPPMPKQSALTKPPVKKKIIKPKK